MIKQIILSCIIALVVNTMYGQKKERIKGDKNVTVNEVSIDAFNKIVIGEKFEINLEKVSNDPAVIIETDDNLHDVIQFHVIDSTLRFSTDKRITSNKKLNISVFYTNALNHIETIEDGIVTSSTDLNLENLELICADNSRAFLDIESKTFNLTNTDRAKIKLDVTTNKAHLELINYSKTEAQIQADTIMVDTYERANSKIEGTTNYLNIKADNGSDFNGKSLTSKSCDILAEINSDIYVNTTDTLRIDMSGSSEVYIYGDPKIEINSFKDSAKLHKKSSN